MKNKNLLVLFLVTSLMLTLTACAGNEDLSKTVKEPKEVEVVESTEKTEEKVEETEEPKEVEVKEENIEIEKEKVEVNLYYANLAYIETGNDDLEELVAVKETFLVENGNLEELIIKKLSENPEDESLVTLIREDITINKAYSENDIAYIDFSSENLHGGSLEETFIIDQIVNTFLNLDYINKVEFLIDGQPADSLMGHISIEDGFSK